MEKYYLQQIATFMGNTKQPHAKNFKRLWVPVRLTVLKTECD